MNYTKALEARFLVPSATHLLLALKVGAERNGKAEHDSGLRVVWCECEPPRSEGAHYYLDGQPVSRDEALQALVDWKQQIMDEAERRTFMDRATWFLATVALIGFVVVVVLS